MARIWALAWSRQAMFLRPMFTVWALLSRVVRFSFERGLCHALEIFGLEAELGQDFLVGNGLSACGGGAGLGDVAGLFFADRLVIDGGVGEGGGDGVEHGLEEAYGGADLSGGQAPDQFVSLLLRVRCCGCHRKIPSTYPEPQPGIYQSWLARRAAHTAAEPRSAPCDEGV